jgi:pseudouridine synthase
MKERLQKVIAGAGITSRRHAEKLISEGRVSVNRVVVTKLGEKADAEKDMICIDGKIISIEKTKHYIMLNKPAGFVTTLHDPQGRPTVMDLVGDIHDRVFPVGRLDYDSRGLLLLTNDGDFSQKIQHPRFQKPKTYRAKIQGCLSNEEIKQLNRGVKISDGIFKPENLTIEKYNNKSTWLSLTLREGRNRIIRRGFDAIGYRVAHLIRSSIGELKLGNLKEGEWRYLTRKEINGLLEDVKNQKR